MIRLLALTFLSIWAAIFPIEAQEIRVMTFNIHHGQNQNGEIDLQQLAAFIRGQQPDVVALQEVDSACSRSGFVDMMQRLGMLTGMWYYFGRAMPYQGGAYGEGLLSSLPILDIQTVPLPSQPNGVSEPRAVIAAVLTDRGNHPFKLLATHLDHQESDTDRSLQVRSLHRYCYNDTLPILLCGDLNAEPDADALQPLWQVFRLASLDANMPTWPAQQPVVRIDYILPSAKHKWFCSSYQVLEESVLSDHRPVMAVFHLK